MINKKGFTLIELLVVMGIIGILAVFLYPSFLNVQDRSKETSVKLIMHTVQLATESYNSENGTFPVVTNITLKQLVDDYLSVGGYLVTVPKNPFTGVQYTADDKAGKIMYNLNSDTNVYTITGYKKNGSSKVMELTNMD